MLSILIPIYNFNTVPLVKALLEQIESAKIPYEIFCLNDASTAYLEENRLLFEFPHVRYEILENNIGRSKIRNLLAQKAHYDWLLFLDADVMPVHANFINHYLPLLNNDIKVVSGGILYVDEKPEQDRLLRWVYGRKREALPYELRNKNPHLSLLTLNFLIHQSVFKKVSFNETIPNLRHEDTLFSYNLMQQRVPVTHIDNPVYHLGLDRFENAMQKEHESLLALKNLIDQQLIPAEYTKISRTLDSLRKWKLVAFIAFLQKQLRPLFDKNLRSTNPSLFVFDLYRLGYLCQLETNHNSNP